MARINVYLPDDLAQAARDRGLNVSRITQRAVRDVLAASETDGWLATVPQGARGTQVAHEDVIAAVRVARRELGSG